MKFEKIIRFRSAYDKRNNNQGIHGVDILFVLKGDKGAVQFLLFTQWYLPHVTEELIKKHPTYDYIWAPSPADLGYHSPKPMYEDDTPLSDECEWLDGKPCYYDGSGLNAEPIFETLLREGSNGVWVKLEEYYNQTFENHCSEQKVSEEET